MRTSHPVRARRGALTVLATVVVLLLAGCGGAASAPAGGGDVPQEPAATIGGGNSTNGNGSGGGGATRPPDTVSPPRDGEPVLDAARRDLLVIKVGTLTVEVEDLDAAVAAATAEIAGLGGYVSGSSQAGAGAEVSASITYRIPADRWEEALVAIRTLATTVVSEQTQTEDVGAQVVDLGARVTNLQATERAIQAVMDRAATIEEILTVQQELTRIRGEIEQAASQRADLQERATYSTLTVRFGLVPAAAPSATPSPSPAVPGFDVGAEVAGATDTLVGILERLATVGIWFGIVWLPIILVLAALGLAAWAIVRRWLPAIAEPVAPPPGPPPAESPPPATA